MKNASLFWRLNLFVHFFIYIYHPLLGAAVTNTLKSTTTLSPKLLDGLQIALCLPTTISSAVVLTVCSNGNEAAAIVNCTIANVLGIVLTPALFFVFLGNLGNVDIAQIFLKLALRVVVPVMFCAGSWSKSHALEMLLCHFDFEFEQTQKSQNVTFSTCSVRNGSANPEQFGQSIGMDRIVETNVQKNS